MKRLWAPWRMRYLESPQERGRCVFCEKPKSRHNDEKNFILYRGKTAYVMLNIFPYNNGHVLISPYRHFQSLEEIREDEALEMIELTKKCMTIMRPIMRPEGFNVGVNQGKAAGASYEHLHIHLLPRWEGDTNFLPALSDTKVISEHIKETYKKMAKSFGSIRAEAGKKRSKRGAAGRV